MFIWTTFMTPYQDFGLSLIQKLNWRQITIPSLKCTLRQIADGSLFAMGFFVTALFSLTMLCPFDDTKYSICYRRYIWVNRVWTRVTIRIPLSFNPVITRIGYDVFFQTAFRPSFRPPFFFFAWNSAVIVRIAIRGAPRRWFFQNLSRGAILDAMLYSVYTLPGGRLLVPQHVPSRVLHLMQCFCEPFRSHNLSKFSSHFRRRCL